MGIDIRLPLGMMFSLVGLLLVILGLVMGNETFERSLGINVNLWWGLVLVIFGATMLFFGRRGGATAHLAEESPEGRQIEEIEHRTGLEIEDQEEG